MYFLNSMVTLGVHTSDLNIKIQSVGGNAAWSTAD